MDWVDRHPWGPSTTRATKPCSHEKSVRRSAQDDDVCGSFEEEHPKQVSSYGTRSPPHHRRSVCGGSGVPIRTFALSNTSENILRVSFPVFVFWSEGWKLEIKILPPGSAYSAPWEN